jgi:A/G-specific adenine glycosylase
LKPELKTRPPLSEQDLTFASRLIAWQRGHGRHDLPWQQAPVDARAGLPDLNARAYRVWLSEIMLQQTQVTAVIPYYQRFLERFPDLASLAAAPLDDVMQLWSGLGYYSRARNLHACAQRVVSEYDGHFPRSPEVIALLPGIGRSTAAAIAVFAFGARAAILDGNVKRVLCRIFGVDGATDEFASPRKLEQHLWTLAETLLPEDVSEGRIEIYIQGLMDLGATLCIPKNPRCIICPMMQTCVAQREGRVEQLPAKKPRAAVPERATLMLLLRHGDEVWLEKRPPVGIWGGLWSLPELGIDATEQTITAWAQHYGMPDAIKTLPPFSHGFTHFTLNVQVRQIQIARPHQQLSDAAKQGLWLPLDEARQAALPTPIKKLLAGLP